MSGFYQVLRKTAEAILAAPFVLAIRLLRPFVRIRFGKLWANRIGHLTYNTEQYLCERDEGLHRRTIDFFHLTKSGTCNRQMVRMWSRRLKIWGPASWVGRFSLRLPGHGPHVVKLPFEYDKLVRHGPHLKFTAREERLGRRGLARLGIPEEAPFICFSARDSAYLKNEFPDRGWDYHDYRDSTIDNYLPAMEEVTRRGYWAVRMGAVVEKKLAADNPMIIDYAANGQRSEFMDIYLGAKCRFFIIDTNGLAGVPAVFRRPIGWANFTTLAAVDNWGETNIFIPKKIRLKDEGRFMTFREMLEFERGKPQLNQQFEGLGIEFVENEPAEILALALEMDERGQGRWRTSPEDRERQERFWDILTASGWQGDPLPWMGAEFLRQNQALLE